MQPASLYSQCMNIIVQHLCEHQHKNVYIILLKQLKQQQGLVQLFTNQVYERLVTWYPSYLTDEILETVSNTRLKSLCLKGCTKVTVEGVQGVLKRCPNVTAVDISGCNNLIKPSFGKALQGHQVKQLTINGCTELSDTILQSITECCHGLEELSLEECEHLTNAAFCNPPNFKELFACLTTLNISGCQNITTNFVRILTDVTRSNLKSVNLSCTMVDCVALIYLAGFVLSLKQAGDEIQSKINTENDPREEDHKDKTVSLHLKKVCAYCSEETRNREPGSFSSLSHLLEEESSGDSELNEKELPKFDLAEWDVISIDDIFLEGKPEQCKCSSKTVVECEPTPMEIDENLLETARRDVGGLENSLVKLFEPNITSLDITQIVFLENGVGSKCLEIFTDANKCLQSLIMSWVFLANDNLQYIARNESDLRSLSLVDCLEINGDGIKAVGDVCHNLVSVDLKGLPFVNDASLIHLIKNNPNLQYLGFAESALSDDVVFATTEVLEEKLVHLDLSWCENITDASVVNLLSKCDKLMLLNLRQCELSVLTLKAIASFNGNMISLGLCGLKGINELSCQGAIQKLTSLRMLTNIDLSWNSLISDSTIFMLLQNCPLLHRASLVGLKFITSKPFLPIITEHKKWYRLRDEICKRLQIQLGTDCRKRLKNFAQFEVIDKAFYLPFRSVNYACELRELLLNYCDKVDDVELTEIVAVCRGTLQIEDYYGEPIKPRWNAASLLTIQ